MANLPLVPCRLAATFVWPLALLTALAPTAPAQTACYGFGSVPVAAQWQTSPASLGCPFAAAWPSWRLFTPAHREPAPHPGFNPGDARELPRLLITYRCTGFLLVPVVPVRVRRSGYVIDQPELPCASA